MAQITLVEAGKEQEFKVMSMQHVRYDFERVSLEMPYFADNGAKGVYLTLTKEEALELAARLTSTVAHNMDRPSPHPALKEEE